MTTVRIPPSRTHMKVTQGATTDRKYLIFLLKSSRILSYNITNTSSQIIQLMHHRILSLIHLEYYHIISVIEIQLTFHGAGDGHPKRGNHHRIIARVRSLKNLPGIGEPDVQRNHVTTDVLVLLAETATYHLLGGRLPLHRAWPTRLPPKKIRVDDVTRIPH